MDDNKNKVLRFRDVTLYTVSAMLFMDQIALAASLGATSLFWWAYVLVLLFLPMAMMTAELGTTYPGGGGVYHWVRTAFGQRWGAQALWVSGALVASALCAAVSWKLVEEPLLTKKRANKARSLFGTAIVK